MQAADTIAVSAAASHSIFTWLLVALVVLSSIANIILIRHHGGWDFVANLPMTNLRILVGIVLFATFNVGITFEWFASQHVPPVDFILAMESALLVNMGLDVTQYGIKRSTTNADIASTQNVQSGITPGPVVSPPAPPPEPGAPIAVVPAPTNTNDAVRAKLTANRVHTGD